MYLNYIIASMSNYNKESLKIYIVQDANLCNNVPNGNILKTRFSTIIGRTNDYAQSFKNALSFSQQLHLNPVILKPRILLLLFFIVHFLYN